jgi:hypothetical protein
VLVQIGFLEDRVAGVDAAFAAIPWHQFCGSLQVDDAAAK